MFIFRTLSIVFSTLCVFSAQASAEDTEIETEIIFDSSEEDWVADYSSAILISAKALDQDNNILPNVRLYFEIAPAEMGLDGGLSSATPPVAIGDGLTDATGTATIRLPLVNGIFDDIDFIGANPTATEPGALYIVTARFGGDIDNETIYTDAGPSLSQTIYRPASSTRMLYVTTEMTRIEIAAGNRVALGETLQLIATLTDPNGDTSETGQETDGPGPKELVNKKVSFYYDSNGDGQAQMGEKLGSNQTNNAGQAVWDFIADPDTVRAGNFTQGLHVQFGGDDYYKLAASISELVVEPGEPDPNLTLLESTISPMPADGKTETIINITLVDLYNNPLGVDAPEQTVEVDVSAGTLSKDVERDPLNGLYSQALRAPFEGDEIEVTVSVVGFPGETKLIIPLEPSGAGCQCNHRSSKSTHFSSLLLSVFLVTLVRRRKNK